MFTVLHGSKSTLHHCALRLGPCLTSRVPTPSPRTSLSNTPPAAAYAAVPAMDGYVPAPGSYTDKVIGCILAALCGDALGAYAEGWTAHRIQEEFENGLTEFKHCRMGLGFYTDDSQMLLALAAVLVNTQGTFKASQCATEFAKSYDQWRGYGGSAGQILVQLQRQLEKGPLPDTMGSELLNKGGSFGNGGAMRVAPLGLAYRNAPLDVLEAALMQTLIPTHHLHPWAIEGALAQALAVAYLCKLQPGATAGATAGSSSGQPDSHPSGSNATAGSTAVQGAAGAPAGAEADGTWRSEQPTGTSQTAPTPAAAATATAAAAATQQGGGPPAAALEFLRVLRGQLQGRSVVMVDRLAVMEEGLHKLYRTPGGPKRPHTSWQDYFASPAWHEELATSVAIAPGEPGVGFQIKGTDAVAAAIWAVVAHWEGQPQDAIVAAVHYGGDTDTIACMAGALVGAHHGSSWLPEQWLTQMESDHPGVEFFNMPAVQTLLSTQGSAAAAAAAADGGAAQQQQEQQLPGMGDGTLVELVRTTRNMGRQGAVVLGRLLARVDSKSP